MMTASSTKSGYHAYLARLYSTPVGNNKVIYWQPQDGTSAYLQISFPTMVKITGIATQGHWDSNVKEFATSYHIQYYDGSRWHNYNSFKVNGFNFTYHYV